MPTNTDVAMVVVYAVLVFVLFIVLISIIWESRKARSRFKKLKLVSLALVGCLLFDSTYWAIANSRRVFVYLGEFKQFWDSRAIIFVKVILIVGVVLCLKFVRNAFQEAYKAAFAVALDETNDAIGVLDEEGNVEHWNRKMYEMFGYDPKRDDVRGKPIKQLIMHGSDMEAERERFDDAVRHLHGGKTGSCDTSVVRRKTKDGRVKVVRISMSRRESTGQRFQGSFGIIVEGQDSSFPWLGGNMAERVAQARNELLSAKNRVCTALSADIVGSSKLIAQDPHNLNVRWLLSEFYERTVEVIDAHDGIVVDLVGDEILAVFGVLDGEVKAKQCQSAVLAIEAAKSIHKEFETIAAEYAERCKLDGSKVDMPRLGVGINTGYMLTGVMGREWLSHFTVLGSTVVDARRVEGLIHRHDLSSMKVVPGILVAGPTVDNAEKANRLLRFRMLPDLGLPHDSDPPNMKRIPVFGLDYIKSADSRGHVFLSYCHENREEVSRLREDLIAAGEAVWWDGNLEAGQDEKFVIRQAMRKSFAVIICFSREFERRSATSVFPEINDAIALYRRYNPASTFLIPVRLSPCDIPPFEIDNQRTLEQIHSIDLYPDSERSARLRELVQAVRRAQGNTEVTASD